MKLLLFGVVSLGMAFPQSRPTGTAYHTVYSSGNVLYGQSSLETSTMQIPPGTTIVHTVTASFSLGVTGGSSTTFKDVQSGGPQDAYDPVATGSIPDDGDKFYYPGRLTYVDPPAIQCLTNASYAPFQPYVDTPQSAGQSLVIWGLNLTGAGLSDPPQICAQLGANLVPPLADCSAGGAISATGFNLGAPTYVSDTQINIPYWVSASASAGQYTLTVTTVGGYSGTSFTVGDASPTNIINQREQFRGRRPGQQCRYIRPALGHSLPQPDRSVRVHFHK